MAFHFIEDEKLIRLIRSTVPGGMTQQLTTAAVERWLGRQPTYPRLIGTTAAARVLGIAPPHVTRLREQGRMPEPIPVEGSVDVWLREDVEALGRVLAQERDDRARKRREKAA